MARRPRRKTSRKTRFSFTNIRAHAARFFGWPWGRLSRIRTADVLRLGALTAFWGAVFTALAIFILSLSLPDIRSAVDMDDRPTIIMRDMAGREFARLGDRQGEILTVADMSPHIAPAVMAIEDRRFYKHFGLDPIGLARAIFTNIRGRGVRQGGSTITQQLAKNLFLTPERTLRRKIKEALLALYLEQRYTKDDILAAYLNRAYFGAGAYGIDSAARVYFNSSARDLSLHQAAMLAGLLKAPSRYSPDNNPELTMKRTRLVLRAMADAGFITPEDAAADVKPFAAREYNAGGSADMRYYADWIMTQIEAFVGPVSQNLVVDTTLDSALQNFASKQLRATLDGTPPDKMVSQGAAIFMKPDGAVVTLIGGRDYVRSQYNRAITAMRQPGSSFKPVLYLTALENGFTPDTMVNDAPVKVGSYAPENFDGKYRGQMRLRDAVALSLNSVAVQTLQQVGVAKTIRMAQRLGITDPLEPDLSLALGSSAVHMMQMAGAYATLANNGLAAQPYGIRAIHTESGITLYERRDVPTAAVLDPKTVADINSILAGVIERGTGQAAKLGTRPAVGKTGTSSDYRDAWFIGYTADYVGCVWVGNDDNTPMKRVTGGSIPARIWRDVMLAAHQGTSVKPLEAAPVTVNDKRDNQSLFDSLLQNLLGDGAPNIQWDSPPPPPEPLVPVVPAEPAPAVE